MVLPNLWYTVWGMEGRLAIPCLRREIRKEDFRQPAGLGQQSGDKGHGEFC